MNRNIDTKSHCQYQFVTKIVEPAVQLFCDFFPDTKEIFGNYINYNLDHHIKNIRIAEKVTYIWSFTKNIYIVYKAFISKHSAVLK